MEIDRPSALLGGLSPSRFMRRHWQKKPLVVRGAIPGLVTPIARDELFALAARDDVESRLVRRDGARWQLRHGPIGRRSLPARSQPHWTLLVQGVDLHHGGVHELLQRFRFVPDARLDDLMVSYASDGGGVGPHLDSYDVFLLQAQGRRRWSIGPVDDARFVDGVPLKILQRFEPEESFVLEAGDMLYLPPHHAHDGVAVGGDCMTFSIGMRAPAAGPLAADLLARLADAQAEGASHHDLSTAAPAHRHYRDPRQPALAHAAEIPPALQAFARQAVQAMLRDSEGLERALGESLTEPKDRVWFEAVAPSAPISRGRGVALDRRTRMLYDRKHLYINGESIRASGRDARLMRSLADDRRLDARQLAGASEAARALVDEWREAGWLHEA